jgi:hypothetical protein
MKAKKKSFSRIGILLLAAVLLLGACLVGTGYAKYRQEVLMTGSVSFSSKLADSFTLNEYVLTRYANGSYVKDSDSVSSEPQTYILAPGMRIPQDPFLTITGKSSVKAVLYLEVTSCSAISYSLTEDWTLLPQMTGRNGGEIYVYQGGTALEESSDSLERISILQNGFQVLDATGSGSVSFIGYLIQCGDTYTSAEAQTLFQTKVLD